MRAVILRHEEHEGEGWFGPALARHGFEAVHRFRAVHAADVDAELLVVLGGSMSACAVTASPYLARELAMLVERTRRGAPCLGICLGAQLLARALGARVHRGAGGPEIGALPVDWTACADAVVGASGSMLVPQWHEDTFSTVPGASALASSAAYEQQAFRIGPSYAFQFHLELDAATFGGWLVGGRRDLASRGYDVDALLARLPALAAGDASRRELVDRLAAHFAAVATRARR